MVIGYAVGPIIISRRLSSLPSLGVVTASLLIATVAYAPFTLLVWPDRLTVPAVSSVVVLAVVCTAVAFLVMFALIAEAGPARMTLITYVNPAVAVLLGALVLDEPLTTGLLVGFPLIIAGSILGTWRSTPPPGDGAAAPLGAQARAALRLSATATARAERGQRALDPLSGDVVVRGVVDDHGVVEQRPVGRPQIAGERPDAGERAGLAADEAVRRMHA